jgi:iron complex outermembrane receptor protein
MPLLSEARLARFIHAVSPTAIDAKSRPNARRRSGNDSSPHDYPIDCPTTRRPAGQPGRRRISCHMKTIIEDVMRITFRKLLLAGTACAVSALFASPAMSQAQPSAQDAAKPAPTAGDDAGDIVVTAQRRSERLQQVPIQMQALTSRDIVSAGIKTTQDALTLTPNATFDQGNTFKSSYITMRGLTQITNADPPIAFVIDGVPQTDARQMSGDLYDVERIEILRGPQGSLYGRNAEGGAINIVTKAPSDHLEGFASAQYGNGNSVNLSGGISGPIVSDKILFRLSGNFRRSDGLIDNKARPDNADFIDHDYSLRGRILAYPTENLTIDLVASYGNFRGGSNYNASIASGNTNDYEDPNFNLESVAYGHTIGASAKIDLDLGFATFTSITGYNSLTQAIKGDADFLPVRGAGQNLQMNLDTISQEFRLVSDSAQRFRWIAGVYYLHTKSSFRARLYFDLDGTLTQLAPPSVALINNWETDPNNAYAAFAQADFDILPNLTITGGLRYDEDRREQRDLVAGTTRKTSFNHLQPKVTLTYKPTGDTLVYATYSTGFRSGGYNSTSSPLQVFPSETLKNYEAGFKAQFFDKKLTLNGAYFIEDVKNYQYYYVLASIGAQIVDGIGDVRIQGLELEATAKLRSDLVLTGAIGTTNSRIRGGAADPADIGNRTPRTVPFSSNLGLQYTPKLSDNVKGLVRVDWQHIGKKYWGADNVNVQNPYDLISARVGADFGKFALYAFGKNLLNERYYTDFFSPKYSGLPGTIGFPGTPRSYGIEASMKF